MTNEKDEELSHDAAFERHFETGSRLGLRLDGDALSNTRGPLEKLPMAKRIEHTLLKIDATPKSLQTLCEEATSLGFRSVCVLPIHIPRCKALLRNTGVKIVSVVNFPLAGSLPGTAEFESEAALDAGADELDFVINTGRLKNGEVEIVYELAASIVAVAKGHLTKAILETGTLTKLELVDAMAAVQAAGVAYAKTSTGFGPRGASIADIELMRLVSGNRVGIKASGGIKDAEWATALVKAGADLIGTSAGPDCIRR